MKTGEWEDIAFRLLALCGGFEKYDILEDVGISARNRRKLSQDRRPSVPELERRGSFPANQQEKDRLISMHSSPELRKSTASLPEEYSRTLSVEKLANQRDSVTQITGSRVSRAMDLDLSTFDFNELRCTNLCSTEL